MGSGQDRGYITTPHRWIQDRTGSTRAAQYRGFIKTDRQQPQALPAVVHNCPHLKLGVVDRQQRDD
ncbi:hypothetical protein B0O80DRAFT_435704 [Mortierella sp. GBAus27b]|nr:hypothetical protein B0O80DRAFT_469516 [Mortierella sp. GBAus27b]KAI8354353.1 hypothetical protein B0O80DRAFT_450850 [Mortierella sp. GBAus27b]KAI8362366.1 hypothetical protein B0O80DRAFT_435704 [Mortierella sp. GBAus27b]